MHGRRVYATSIGSFRTIQRDTLLSDGGHEIDLETYAGPCRGGRLDEALRFPLSLVEDHTRSLKVSAT